MQYKQKLQQIISNQNIHRRDKIKLIQGLKELLAIDTRKTKRIDNNKCSTFKSLAEHFDNSYKKINEKAFNTQKQLLIQHKNCLQKINSSDVTKSDKLKALKQLQNINRKLNNFLNELKDKKEDLRELSSCIEDHLRVKKTKMQMQFQKNVMAISKNKSQNHIKLSNLIKIVR